MNMNEMMEKIQQFYVAVIQAEQGAGYLVRTREGMIILIAATVAGILIGFFGLKIVRFWTGFFGLGAGLAGGTAVALLLGMDGGYAWIPGVVLGVILAGLMAWLYRFGAFVMIWAAAFAVCSYIISPDNMIVWAVCAVIGLALALLSLKFLSIVTILVTSVFGGLLAGTAVFPWIPLEGTAVYAGICILFVAVCLLVQRLLESRKRKRQSLKKAAEIRKTHSTANEVERARALAENLDKFDDEPEMFSDSVEEELETPEEDLDIELEEIDEEEFDYLDDEDEADAFEDEDMEEEQDYLDEEESDDLDEDDLSDEYEEMEWEETDYLDDEESDERKGKNDGE